MKKKKEIAGRIVEEIESGAVIYHAKVNSPKEKGFISLKHVTEKKSPIPKMKTK